MAMQTEENRFARLSDTPSGSGTSGIVAPLLVAGCLLAGLVAVSLLGPRDIGGGDAPIEADTSGAWIMGP
ncbi:MAG TPA: hypothetical protein VKX28_00890 [Xanthobacteraceae bacterium]|nr:hypothetical protein [Xanthobacteraceae bacterium]